MANHIAALSRSCFFHMRQLRSIRHSLTSEAMLTLIQAFVSSRLDYCNSVLVAGVSSQLLQKMQVIQNAAARFVTGARRRDHMTPVLRKSHWLPVRQRIRFKTAVMVYKCIHGLAPSYLASHCKPTSSALVGPICDPPRLANSTFLARRLTMGSEVSLSMDQLSGTAYLLNFGHLTSRRTFSKPS